MYVFLPAIQKIQRILYLPCDISFIEEHVFGHKLPLTTRWVTDIAGGPDYNAVLVGLAPEAFHYAKLNEVCVPQGKQFFTKKKYKPSKQIFVLKEGFFKKVPADTKNSHPTIFFAKSESVQVVM